MQGRFGREGRYKQLVFRGSDWLTSEDSTGDGGEVHTPKVSGATKGTNPVQEVQTSAIKSLAWLEGQGDGQGWAQKREVERTECS